MDIIFYGSDLVPGLKLIGFFGEETLFSALQPLSSGHLFTKVNLSFICGYTEPIQMHCCYPKASLMALGLDLGNWRTVQTFESKLNTRFDRLFILDSMTLLDIYLLVLPN